MPEKDKEKTTPSGTRKAGKNSPKESAAAIGAARPLPFSDEAEKSVLSSILQRPEESIQELDNKLQEDDFYIPSNKILFRILLEMHDKHIPLEPAALLQRLIDTGNMEAIGGAGAISDLYSFLSNPASISYYAGIVEEKATVRRLITACADGIELSYGEHETVAKLLDQVEERVGGVRKDDNRNGIRHIRDLTDPFIDELDAAARNNGQTLGLEVGFPDLDAMTQGLQGGDMFIIAARPSVGKTALMMNMVEHVALGPKPKPVLVFSLEMSAKTLLHRLVSSRSGIDSKILRSGLLTKEQTTRLFQTLEQLNKSHLLIDETPGISVTEMRRKSRAIKKQYPEMALIAIDYLQLMTSNSRRAQENRQIEISEISAGIKAIAKELEIPAIVLAQLNRQVDQRKGAQPVLSDLRESGSIEQDADLVGLLTRTDYAGGKGAEDDAPKRGKGSKTEKEDEEKPGITILNIAKHRNGPTGKIGLTFVKEFTRFVSAKLPDNDAS